MTMSAGVLRAQNLRLPGDTQVVHGAVVDVLDPFPGSVSGCGTGTC